MHGRWLSGALFAIVWPHELAAQRGPGVRYEVVSSDTAWRPFFTGYGTRHDIVMRGGRVTARAYPIVTAVHPGSPADSAGVQVGDEIVAINGYDTALRADSARYVGAGRRALVGLRRGDSVFFVAITPMAMPRRER